MMPDCEPPAGVGFNELEMKPLLSCSWAVELDRVPGAVPVPRPVGTAVVFERGNGMLEPIGLVNEVVSDGVLPVLGVMLVGAAEKAVEFVGR